MMKNEYLTPSTEVIELQYMAHLLQASGVKALQTTDGLGLGLSDEGGNETILDR